MLLVVFGAGASFDSVPTRDWSFTQGQPEFEFIPPLAQDLFLPRKPYQDAIDRYPACIPMLATLRNVVDRGQYVEEFLEVEVERAQGDPRVLSQLIALRFYINDVVAACSNQWLSMFHRVTNYTILMDTIERWRGDSNESTVAMVTFNYDRMPEDACIRTLGWDVREIAGYVKGYDSNYRLIKLHGSI